MSYTARLLTFRDQLRAITSMSTEDIDAISLLVLDIMQEDQRRLEEMTHAHDCEHSAYAFVRQRLHDAQAKLTTAEVKLDELTAQIERMGMEAK